MEIKCSKKIMKNILMLAITATMMVGCSKETLEESMTSGEPNSVLQIRTRAGGDDVTISYPVQVYVF